MTQIQMVRLIADEGKVLTNGEVQGSVIDVFPVENKSLWYEIDAPEELEQEDDEPELTEGE